MVALYSTLRPTRTLGLGTRAMEAFSLSSSTRFAPRFSLLVFNPHLNRRLIISRVPQSGIYVW